MEAAIGQELAKSQCDIVLGWVVYLNLVLVFSAQSMLRYTNRNTNYAV